MSEPDPPSAPGESSLRWLPRIIRGRPDDPAWIRPAFLATLLAAGLLTTWALDVNGYGNSYYASAALAGSDSWSAWFYGALDSAGFITVDKPPLSIWVTSLSIRAFGLSSWSVLLPQAVAGMATTYILFRTVRRWHGPTAAVGATIAMAVTPVAVVIFRYNNPDAVLTLLMVGALALAYGAIRSGSRLRLWAAFGLVGLGFLTKTTQALLVVPAIGVAYLVASPHSMKRRIADLGLGLAVMVVMAGWWIAAVELMPADARPYIGGTTGNSFLEYVFGYNGLGRIFGQDGPAGDADPFGGGAGWTRLFNAEVGGQVSWLLIPAFGGLAAALWRSRRRAWSDPHRAGYLLWGTALVVHAAAFSFAHGVFHPYYTVTMAPMVAALAAVGFVELWRLYGEGAPWPLAVVVVLSGWWASVLLGRTPEFLPWLRMLVIAGAIAASLALLLATSGGSPAAVVARAAAVVGVLVALAGPAAYALDSLGTSFAGGDPKAGPESVEPPGPLAAGPGIPYGGADDSGPSGPPARPGIPDQPALPPLADARPPVPGNGYRPPLPDAPDGPAPQPGRSQAPGANPGPPQPGLDGGLVGYLLANRGSATWLVAVTNAHTSAPLMLRTGEPVMTMGGFGGRDPALTTEDLAGYVETGELRFVIEDAGGGNRESATRVRWLETHCEVVSPADYGGRVGSAILYDCGPDTTA